MAAYIKRDLYSEVTARILAELERGAAPWVKPWSATPGQNVPQNAVSNRPYSGCNVVLLWLTRGQGWPTPRFLTFKQAQEAGGSVRKGERGTKVYFVKQLRVTETKEGENLEKLVPMMREYVVFNVRSSVTAFRRTLFRANQQGFAIQIPGMCWRMNSLPQAGQSFARAKGKLTTPLVQTSLACLRSLHSVERITPGAICLSS